MSTVIIIVLTFRLKSLFLLIALNAPNRIMNTRIKMIGKKNDRKDFTIYSESLKKSSLIS